MPSSGPPSHFLSLPRLLLAARNRFPAPAPWPPSLCAPWATRVPGPVVEGLPSCPMAMLSQTLAPPILLRAVAPPLVTVRLSLQPPPLPGFGWSPTGTLLSWTYPALPHQLLRGRPHGHAGTQLHPPPSPHTITPYVRLTWRRPFPTSGSLLPGTASRRPSMPGFLSGGPLTMTPSPKTGGRRVAAG